LSGGEVKEVNTPAPTNKVSETKEEEKDGEKTDKEIANP